MNEKPHCKVACALRTAIAIIRNDARSPIWDHAPEVRATHERWCRELIEESGIDEFDSRDFPDEPDDDE